MKIGKQNKPTIQMTGFPVETEDKCPNCGQPVTGNFCANCGQKRYKRINRKYIWDEAQYTLIHTNKGLPYSIKHLIINPGKTGRRFIDGNRVKHYKPLLLTFLLSGIAAFIALKIIGMKDIVTRYYSSLESGINTNIMTDIMTFIFSYYSLLILLAIPLFAITTKLAFKSWGHNYYEHIVMNAYIVSFYILMSIILVYPMMYVFKSDPNTVIFISTLSSMTIPFILIWFFKGFYSEKKLKSIVGRVLMVLGLIIVEYFGIIIISAIAGLIIAILQGPEALEHLKLQ